MSDYIYIVVPFIITVVISLTYGFYERRVDNPRFSHSQISWINVMIMTGIIFIGADLPAIKTLLLIFTTSIISGVYLLYVRPKLKGD